MKENGISSILESPKTGAATAASTGIAAVSNFVITTQPMIAYVAAIISIILALVLLRNHFRTGNKILIETDNKKLENEMMRNEIHLQELQIARLEDEAVGLERRKRLLSEHEDEE